jgi:glyoxylase-like metal-dependent hydrolase (beta-lactamase superfamily II)
MHKISDGILMMRTNERVCSTVYVLEHEGKRLIIDSGDGKLAFNFTPEICILTHGHYDHAKGVKPEWKNVFLHPADFSKKPYITVPPNAKKLDFATLSFGPFQLEMIHTPGHTDGSICILEKKSGLLFSGDTKFAQGDYGRTDLEGSEEEMQKSLARIDKLGWKLLCPAHGYLEQREDGKLI